MFGGGQAVKVTLDFGFNVLGILSGSIPDSGCFDIDLKSAEAVECLFGKPVEQMIVEAEARGDDATVEELRALSSSSLSKPEFSISAVD